MDVVDDIESVLYIAREVSGASFHSGHPFLNLTTSVVYKIPPRTANEGYRANDWGDLGSPLWKGRLRILENSKGAVLQLEDSQTGAASLSLPSRKIADLLIHRRLYELDP